MIFCKKKDLVQYLGMSAEMDQAIRAIGECDLAKLAMGRNELGGEVFGNRFDYETQPEANMLYETHVTYADIHLLLSGEEFFVSADLAQHEKVEEKPDKDYIGSQGPWEACVKLTPEDVCIVLPGEAHKAKCMIGQPVKVEKFVVKVPFKA